MVATRSGADTKTDMADMRSPGKKGRGLQGGLQGGLEARLERGLERGLEGVPFKGARSEGLQGLQTFTTPPLNRPPRVRSKILRKHLLDT